MRTRSPSALRSHQVVGTTMAVGDSDPAKGLAILHVVVRATATNSQYNEHCLPVRDTRRITVCSLFPADVDVPSEIRLVEGDGSVRGTFAALRRALRGSSYDVVHVHAAAAAMVALAVYLVTGRPRRDLVFTVHNSWASFRPRNQMFLHLIAAMFPVVVVCGQAAAASLPRRIRLIANHLEVIPNGVDLDRVDAALTASDRPATGVAGRAGAVTVGRLIPIKDPDVVLAAFLDAARLDDTLTVVGDGPLAAPLAATVRHIGATQQVRFTGPVPRDDVYPILAGAAVFVSASRGEGLPVAVLEAMACRCPVVLSDIAPHREIARRTPAVRLVRVGDTRGLAAAVAEALRVGADERAEQGDLLRRAVAEHFSVRTMNQRYGRVYRRVAHAAATGARS